MGLSAVWASGPKFHWSRRRNKFGFFHRKENNDRVHDVYSNFSSLTVLAHCSLIVPSNLTWAVFFFELPQSCLSRELQDHPVPSRVQVVSHSLAIDPNLRPSKMWDHSLSDGYVRTGNLTNQSVKFRKAQLLKNFAMKMAATSNSQLKLIDKQIHDRCSAATKDLKRYTYIAQWHVFTTRSVTVDVLCKRHEKIHKASSHSSASLFGFGWSLPPSSSLKDCR